MMSLANRILRVHASTPAGRIMRLPLRLIPSATPMPILGGINKGMRWVAGSHIAGCWLGTYEAGKQREIARHTKAGMIAYDVGAHAGYYTLAFSRLVGPAGHVFAFEPDGRNVQSLRRNLVLNNVSNVTIVQAALAQDAGLVRFAPDGAEGKIVAHGGLLIPSVSLDSFIGAGNPKPAIIKMDIEGSEEAAIKGARSLIDERCTIWIAGDEPDCRIRSSFAANGYRIETFTGNFEWENAVADFVALPDHINN